jgi:hypothetical protein
MYELNVNSRKQLERASLRAQAQKPRIEEIALGMYKVFSTNPATPYNSYSTGIFPAKDGNGYDVVCSCPTQRVVCKHAPPIFPHYLMMRRKSKLTRKPPKWRPRQKTRPVLYADLIPSFDDEVKPQLPPVEVARAQAEQALAALAASGFQPTKPGEEIQSIDRHCPKCGLVQPDDDSTECLACGAILDPEDEYTAAQADYDRACLFG